MKILVVVCDDIIESCVTLFIPIRNTARFSGIQVSFILKIDILIIGICFSFTSYNPTWFFFVFCLIVKQMMLSEDVPNYRVAKILGIWKGDRYNWMISTIIRHFKKISSCQGRAVINSPVTLLIGITSSSLKLIYLIILDFILVLTFTISSCWVILIL